MLPLGIESVRSELGQYESGYSKPNYGHDIFWLKTTAVSESYHKSLGVI